MLGAVLERVGGRLSLLLVSAPLFAGCGMTGSLGPTAGLWGLNESSNMYLIRVWSADMPSTFALDAGAAGFVSSGRALEVEVLDAVTCSLVASRAVSGNLLVGVDARGRVEFLSQPEAPAMDFELERSAACPTATPPPGDTTS